MKKLGFALAAATMLTAAPALAADLAPLRQAPVLAAAPLYNWSGLYLGIQGGFAWGSSRHRNSACDITGNFDISGVL
ncbi:MAG: porin family protein, partial [Rhizobiales bacterium]|nr:porin family protein [Hyphomicrobiales bacterium]